MLPLDDRPLLLVVLLSIIVLLLVVVTILLFLVFFFALVEVAASVASLLTFCLAAGLLASVVGWLAAAGR